MPLPAILALVLVQDDAGPRGRQDGDRTGAPQDLWLAFNNTTTAVRLADQTVVLLYQHRGSVIVRRGKSEKKIGEGNGLVALGTDGTGTLLALWCTRGSIAGAWSQDGGGTFETGSVIARGLAPAVRVWRSGGDLRAMIAYHLGDEKMGEIRSIAYAEGRWGEPARIDSAGKGSYVSLSGRGDTCVAAWKDFRNGRKSSDIYLADFRDGRWSVERPAGFAGADPCVVEDANGRLHLGYQTAREVFYTSSANGKTWDRPTKVGAGLFAHVAVNAAGRIAITYEKIVGQGSFRDDRVKTVGLAVSADGGKTFRTEIVDGDKTGLTRAHLSLADDGALSLFYVDRSAGAGFLVVRELTVR